jgi:hypothetical protein
MCHSSSVTHNLHWKVFQIDNCSFRLDPFDSADFLQFVDDDKAKLAVRETEMISPID